MLKKHEKRFAKHRYQIHCDVIDQYHALERCIELSWRRGAVEQAENYLKNALSANPRSTLDAGYNYCKGLHEWY